MNDAPIDKRDILDIIFDFIGVPEQHNFTDEMTIKYLSKFKPRDKKPFIEVFPRVSQEGLELMEKMLSFNPSDRPTAGECLGNEYFKDVREHLEEQGDLDILVPEDVCDGNPTSLQ